MLDPSAVEAMKIYRSALSPCLVEGTWTEEPAIDVRERLAEFNRAVSEKRTSPDIERVNDVRVETRDGHLLVRVYRPADPRSNGSVVYCHGGGWVLGSIDGHDYHCRRMAEASGRTIVSVDYRLAPEHPFPAAFCDAVDATAWWFDHAEAYGCDPALISIAGDSAGGNLASVVSINRRDAGLALPATQVLIYPVVDDDTTTASYSRYDRGYHLGRGVMEWFFTQYFQDPSDRAHPGALPLKAPDLSGLPPTLVLTAECDPLCTEGEKFADRLSTFDVPVEYRCFGGMIHSFYAASDEALAVTSEFLERRLPIERAASNSV